MVVKKFLRRVWSRHSKLGKGRKKKQVWRRPTGRHNKMRWKRGAYPAVVSIGYKQTDREEMLKVDSLKDLEKIEKGQTIIVGKMGKKKKLEVMEAASKKGINVYKLNAQKFVKNNTKKKNESK